jgi:hypothetical protein
MVAKVLAKGLYGACDADRDDVSILSGRRADAGVGAIGGAVDTAISEASRSGVVAPLASESIKDLRSSRATSVSCPSVGCGAGCPTGLRYESKGSY